ncbi:MAG: peptidoglycan-binding domain-containing protein [Candidatus Omnitrophota bacterium]
MAYKSCRKILLIIILFLICGCATTGRKNNSEFEVQELKNQILVLEKQIQEKNNLINDLKESLRNAKEKNFSKTTSKKSKRSTRQIQTALKNAGYNPGKIDGKMGKNTRRAIKSFQKNNGIKANGKVNDRTWNILSKYLNKK